MTALSLVSNVDLIMPWREYKGMLKRTITMAR